MGNGYWIIVWDSWGSGLNMVNPRMHTEINMLNKTDNWFSDNGNMTDEEIIAKHQLDKKYNHFRIIR